MAETLREYLISLGWKIDEASWRKYEGALLRTGEVTFKVGATALETATAIEAMVTRVARQYETLYYVSQRSGKSVNFIQSTQYGFKQIGLSADQAANAIEAVSSALRLNPGLKALVGGESDPTKIMDRFAKMPYFVGSRLASLFGVPDDVFRQYTLHPDWEKKAAQEHRDRLKNAGLDVDKFADRVAGGPGSFTWSLNATEDELKIFGDRVASDFLGPAQWMIDKMGELVHWLNGSDEAAHKLIDTITLLSTAGGSWLLLGVLGRVLKALGLIKTATVTTEAAAVGFGGTGAAAGATAAGGTSVIGTLARGGWLGAVMLALETEKRNDPETKSWLREKLGPLFYRLGLSTTPDLNAAAGTPRSGAPAGRDKQVVDYFVAQGWTRDQAVGIAANLKRESNLQPLRANAQGLNFFGLAQWDAGRQAAFARWAGHSMKDSTMEEQLAFVQYELTHGEQWAAARVRQATSASDAARAFSRYYERTDHPEREEPIRANIADELSSSLGQQYAGGVDSHDVVIHQKTDIHVAGGGPPSETARLVLDKQGRVNDNLVRNLSSNVR